MKEEDVTADDIDFGAVGFEFDEEGQGSALPIAEVFGSGQRSAERQAASAQKPSSALCYFFYPTWRSQLINLGAYLVACVLTVAVSRYLPRYLVLAGSLFPLGGHTYYLYFPLLILVPGFLLSKILINMYDAKYIIDDEGVEAQVGLVSFNLRQPRLRWEDIRGIEPVQTLWERFLSIGTVHVGTSATEDVDIDMYGVANPRAIQLLIDGERRRRLNEMKNGAMKVSRVAMSE